MAAKEPTHNHLVFRYGAPGSSPAEHAGGGRIMRDTHTGEIVAEDKDGVMRVYDREAFIRLLWGQAPVALPTH